MKSLHGGYLPDYPSPYLKDIYLILPQRLVLGDLQNLHSLHWGMYRGITWSPTKRMSTVMPVDLLLFVSYNLVHLTNTIAVSETIYKKLIIIIMMGFKSAPYSLAILDL